jgi:hypothetical protein
MERGDEHDTHTWSSIGWQAALLVRKLRNQAPERGPMREAPGQFREGVDLTKRSPAPGMNRREAVIFRMSAGPR